MRCLLTFSITFFLFFVFLFFSTKVFFRAALAILKLSEPTLLQLDLESIMTYLSRFPHGGEWVLEKENLVPAALSIKVNILKRKQRYHGITVGLSRGIFAG